MTVTWSYPYDPSDRQLEAGAADVDELLFGGAAGGGKSEMLLAAGVNTCLAVPGCKVILFRRSFPEIEQEIEPRLLGRIPGNVAKYNSTKHTWVFRNGSRLVLGVIAVLKDVYRYLGAEYVLVLWDELTLFDPKAYLLMKGRLRMAGHVREVMVSLGLRPRMMGATNPGGPAHIAVKDRFVDPAPPSTVFPIVDEEGRPTGETGMFIKSLPSDNPHLDLEDYNRKLAGMDPVMRRAYRDGDWDILDGVRFSQWRNEIHVITPGQMPPDFHPLNYPCCVGVDYGSEAPFSAHWLALLPDRRVLVYRELHAKGLTPKEQAQAIKDAEMVGERSPTHPMPVALDPACWTRAADHVHKSSDPNMPPPGSIAHSYRLILGGAVVKARNERVGGWALVDEHLRVRDDGRPGLEVVDTCRSLIRTLPALPRSNTNPEDVNSAADDHDADSLRYGLQLLAGRPGKIPATPAWELTMARGRRAESVTGGLDTIGF